MYVFVLLNVNFAVTSNVGHGKFSGVDSGCHDHGLVNSVIGINNYLLNIC